MPDSHIKFLIRISRSIVTLVQTRFTLSYCEVYLMFVYLVGALPDWFGLHTSGQLILGV